MCLGTVAKVVEVIDEGRAVVEHGGTQYPGRREDVLKMTVGDDIRPGDWVVIHSGFVLERISEARALDALAIRATPVGTSPPATSPAATSPAATSPAAPAPPATTGSHTSPPATTCSHNTGSHTNPGAPAAPQHKEVAL